MKMISLIQRRRFVSRRWQQQQWIGGGRNYAIVATYLRMMNDGYNITHPSPSPLDRWVVRASSTPTIYHQNLCYYLPLTDSYRTISLQSRGFVRSAHDGGRIRDPDMRNCKSIEELIDMAYDHKDMMSPRGMAAFWTLVSRLLQRRGRPTPKHEHMQMQIDQLIGQTLQSIDTYNA